MSRRRATTLLLQDLVGMRGLHCISLAVQSAGAHNESLRRWTDVMKGITSDERQRLTCRRFHYPRFFRTNNIGEADTIEVLPARNGNTDEIARLEFAQAPKEGIAVRGKGYIAYLSWQGSPRDMSNCYSKYLWLRPFSDHD